MRFVGFYGKHKDDWREVSAEHRADGWLFDGGLNPACIRGAADLGREFAERLAANRPAGMPLVDAEGDPIPARKPPEALLLEVLNLDRRCAEWYPYSPGFSPKEHVEQLQMMQLEEDRRQHEISLAQLQNKSDERAASIAESLHQVTVETGKFTTRWTYVAVTLAAAALAVIAANYLFPEAGRALGNYIVTHAPSP